MSKQATHNLKVKVKSGHREGSTSIIGGCWLNNDGSLSIQLNVGVTLKWDDNIHITAFPRDAQKKMTGIDDD